MKPTSTIVVTAQNELAALASEANSEHAAGEAAIKSGMEHFRAAGRALFKAKERCKHGEWIPWLKANVKFSARTAQNYMSIATSWNVVKDLDSLRDALDVIRRESEDSTVPKNETRCVFTDKTKASSDVSCPLLDGRSWVGFRVGDDSGVEQIELFESKKHPDYYHFTYVPSGTAQDVDDMACGHLDYSVRPMLKSFLQDNLNKVLDSIAVSELGDFEWIDATEEQLVGPSEAEREAEDHMQMIGS